MVSIFVPAEERKTVQAVIDSELRLGELVFVKPLSELDEGAGSGHLIVRDGEIRLPIDWASEAPPYLLPYPLPFTPGILLAVVFARLNNFEKAYAYGEDSLSLLHDLDTLNCIQHGVAIGMPQPPAGFGTAFDEYRFWHNAAVVGHYAEPVRFVPYDVIRRHYERAFALAPNDEYRAFTGKHWATLLLDAEELDAAEALLTDCIAFALSEEAVYELKNVQCGVWMKQLTAPYDPVRLARLKDTLWAVLQHYERKQNRIQTALVLVEASQVANFSDSFSEALGYINRAVQLLEEEQIPELVANAQYRKGTLLYTWAQNGNPQFFRPAMDAYQQALRVFTRENTPEVFAEIHHHLGVIYSEIPDEARKKGVWAAVSVGSFKEALRYFTRVTHPYEYARICNSYANALTKYPEARLVDNYTKALDFYREALDIRTAEDYPYERVLTILNFLEAAWLVSIPDAGRQQQLLDEMTKLADEVPRLVADPALLAEAHRHRTRLDELRKVIAAEV